MIRESISSFQQRQIDALTAQAGIKTIRGRNEFVSRQVGREIEHLIDISADEARAVVDVLTVELKAREAK